MFLAAPQGARYRDHLRVFFFVLGPIPQTLFQTTYELETNFLGVIEAVEFNGHGLRPLQGVQGQVGEPLEPVQPRGALKTPSLG